MIDALLRQLSPRSARLCRTSTSRWTAPSVDQRDPCVDHRLGRSSL